MINEELIDKYLVFKLDEDYALPLEKIVEIVEMGYVTKIPETPSYIMGVMNLRGRVIPLIDLRVRFKKPPCEDLSHQCVVITNFDDIQIGLIVDNVDDLITMDPQQVTPPPTVGKDYAHVFIREIGIYQDQMKLILDGDKLINHQDLDFMSQEE